MLDEITLERRLVTLEQAVSDLQQKIESKPTSENWLQKLVGSISDEAAFMEALEYGRTFRQADKPVDEGNEQS
ncbi:transferase hexapeptide repeat containing protein (plasmid) [Kovacikia minuta CCNUW1]|uniref:transferase hexapeptide repeat containing protein n=1 Tax=Kovacikia minuta TaxID=2931930 RepID=UPI001CCD0810|nr:transferase hexapeptide repeat containing protein [Kovacikia minuta]UBF29812.1 transferase hexapeptide repeat containing protein [Kovacikia minuta CCNUW1]